MLPIHLLLTSVHFGSNQNTLVFKINKPRDNTSESFAIEKPTPSSHSSKQKIYTISSNLTTSALLYNSSNVPPPFSTKTFSKFSPVSLLQLPGMRSSTCVVDPILLNIVNSSHPTVSSFIKNINNSSLSFGSVPQTLKLGAITHPQKPWT